MSSVRGPKLRRGEKWFARRIVDYINEENQNCIILVTGGTGKGKSYGSLRIQEAVGREAETEEERLFRMYSDRDFSRYIYQGDIRKFDIIFYDDPGISAAGNYEQLTLMGRTLAYVAQSWRHRNVVLIMATPSAIMINKNYRRFAHYELKPPSPTKTSQLPKTFQKKNINRSKGLSIWDLKELEFEPDAGRGVDKVYKKYIRDKNKRSGEEERIEGIILKHPDRRRTEEYESEKEPAFLQIYRERIQRAWRKQGYEGISGEEGGTDLIEVEET